ncbi:transposase, partial [Burkholderia ambifaria]|uniref:transposase n=2 Tax=Burkholderia ambifaria TaxID=152480 RepID=UPI001FC8B932
MSKTTRARYTREFKLEAVRLVKAGQSVAAVAATLDVPAQSISNWVKAEQEGKLGGAGTKPVSPEQMELSRLRAEVARLKMERDILKKAWVGSIDRCNTFLLISNEGGLTNGTNGTAGVVARRQVRGLAAV